MKRFFSKDIYLDGLRQSKIIWIIITSLMLIPSILMGVSRIVGEIYPSDFAGTLGGLSDNPSVIFSYVALVPFLTLNLFSFLNKRSKSDFFHSLPHPRTRIFVSYSMSILTCVLLTLVLCTSASFITTLFSGGTFTFLWAESILMLIASFATSLMVMAATLIAMSITGTIFSNITVALIIIFLPRFLLTILSSSLTTAMTVVADTQFGFLGTQNYNIAFHTVFGIFTSGNNTSELFTYQYTLYTAVLGLVYIVIAGICFMRRKSETAGFSSINKHVQSAVRVAVSLVFSVTATAILIGEIRLNDQNTYGGLYLSVAFYLVSLLSYFGYELITTKKLSSLKNTLPALGVIIVLNLALYGGSSLYVKSQLSVDWDAAKIDYVTILDDIGYGSCSYFDLALSELKLEDPVVKEKISAVLTANQNDVHTDGFPTSENQRLIHVSIDGKTYDRKLFLDTSVWKYLVESEEVRALLDAFPTDAELTSISEFSYNSIPTEYRQEVLDAFNEDIQNLDTNKKIELLTSRYNQGDFNCNIMGRLNGKEYSQYLNPSFDTPKALAKIIELRNIESIDKFDSYIKKYIKDENKFPDYSSMDVTIYDIKKGDSFYIYASLIGSDEGYDTNMKLKEKDGLSAAITTVYEASLKSGFDLTKPYACFHIGGNDGTFEHYINVDENFVGLLEALQYEDMFGS